MNSQVLGGPVRTVRYGYDAGGNRLSRIEAQGCASVAGAGCAGATEAGVVTTYVVDANDRLSTEMSGGFTSRLSFSEGEGAESMRRVFDATPPQPSPSEKGREWRV